VQYNTNIRAASGTDGYVTVRAATKKRFFLSKKKKKKNESQNEKGDITAAVLF